MIPTSINVQITKSPKQYEAVRLGFEATLTPGETVDEAIKEGMAELNRIYAEMQNAVKAPTAPAQAPAQAAPTQADNREFLNVGDKRVQQIVNRIQKEPGKKAEIMANVDKYYRYDDNVKNVLNAACEFI